MELSHLNNIYFIGIGGIGMSALARYFNERNIKVSGYDRAASALTKAMEQEGIEVNYDLNIDKLDKEADLVVYTPAIHEDNVILKWYREHQFKVLKRSDVLQLITENMFSITVAGTHGKTTTSTMIAHILRDTGYGCNAFLGGISANYEKNYWKSNNHEVAVIEADEYDRSFLKLHPDIAILTAISPDHLDVYGTEEAMIQAFVEYTNQIKENGTLWYKFGLPHASELTVSDRRLYSLQNSAADVYAKNIVTKKGGYTFDVMGPNWTIPGFYLQIGGMHNVENAVVAIAVAKQLEIEDFLIKEAIANFKGVHRRFEYVYKTDKTVYIDDYAHHPEELYALIHSAKNLFKNKKCVVAFQPHLYSRTKDFVADFARSLDLADEVILLDIYPAREEPIPGVSSQSIADLMGNPNHTILTKEGLLDYVKYAKIELLITAGAGDIDRLVAPIKEILENKDNG